LGVLKAYDFRNGAHRAPIAALEADVGPYRLRRDQDAVWPPKNRAYGGESENLREKLAEPALMAARLALPVALLITLLGAAYLFTDAFLLLPGAPKAVQNAMLAVSDLIVPMAWFSIHLTNRRYGAAHAFAQLLAGLLIVTLVALFNPGDIDNWTNNNPAISWRAMLAFQGSFLFANFIAIVFFDAVRGTRWWTAPLAASFTASLVFSAVYYLAAFAGDDVVTWTDSALVHFAVFFAESVVLLVPYFLLRPAMRPTQGMNGY
jgi:hypothetical protein